MTAVITIADLRMAADLGWKVSFNADPCRFYINTVAPCGGSDCRLDAGEPCAGVMEIEPVDQPATQIPNVHIGARGTYRQVSL